MTEEVSTGLGHRACAFTFSELPARRRAVLGLHIREMKMQKEPREKATAVTVTCVLNPAPPLQSCGILLRLHPTLRLLISQRETCISPSYGLCV